jgi:hypothetical protein
MNLLQACIDVLFFHHPAAWWISGQVRAEREHCADDLAVRVLEAGHAGSRLSYAKALLALEERRQANALALAANGGSLLDRIRRLTGVEEQPASPVRPLAAAVMATLLVAVLVMAAAPIREARADELPKDTNKIESLTVEQAKKLVEEFPGVTVEITSKNSGSYKLEKCLPVNGLKKLMPDVAQALAGYSRGPLILDGLTTLSDETAKALAGFTGHLLSIDGLARLDAATARALADLKGWQLSLSGLATLDVDATKAIAKFKGHRLDLNGLTTLDAATAQALAEFESQGLGLSGLPALDADAAKALAEFKGEELHLGGLPTLDADTAKSLDGFRGFLFLSILDKSRTNFFTNNPLTRETALAWVVVSNGQLSAVTALDSPDSVAIAKALATRKGPLSLPNLKKLSPKTLSALLEKEDIEIPLIETL